MSNDLISRKEVLKLIHTSGGCDSSNDYDKGWDECVDHLYSEVESMPTAYDPDKVVEQLEEYGRNGDLYLQSVIEIVKEGGINEND
ncbi:MAG: hypothetical protein ACLRZ9_06070 [Eubacterium sp.]